MNGASEIKERALEIDAEIRGLKSPSVPKVRRIRRRISRELHDADAEEVLALARELHHVLGHRWVALELIHDHRPCSGLIARTQLEEFARGLDSWGAVDAFAVLLAGPAWLRKQVSDQLYLSWARSEDRWLRRAALASTVVLNTPSRGGTGDAPRTLAICEVMVDDRDDMVVKALSWALRKLSERNKAAVECFLGEHESRLAARVKREVRNKLTTGLKNPKISTAASEV